jgi:hypothetical protein
MPQMFIQLSDALRPALESQDLGGGDITSTMNTEGQHLLGGKGGKRVTQPHQACNTFSYFSHVKPLMGGL